MDCLYHSDLFTVVIRSKSRLYIKFINGLNEATNIMTQNLAQDFVPLRHVALASQAFAKLGLNHTERRFDIRKLVVVFHEVS